MSNLALPDDQVAFLKEGRQLEYDPATCEIGRVSLLPLDQLKVELFGVSMQNSSLEKEDPFAGVGGCYLVDGVSLLAACKGYDPEGMLLWLPWERRYGTWDSNHLGIHVFPPETTWLDIAADLPKYVNRQWGNWTREQTLVPWPRYVHCRIRLYRPQLITRLSDPEFMESCDFKFKRNPASPQELSDTDPAEVHIPVKDILAIKGLVERIGAERLKGLLERLDD